MIRLNFDGVAFTLDGGTFVLELFAFVSGQRFGCQDIFSHDFETGYAVIAYRLMKEGCTSACSIMGPGAVILPPGISGRQLQSFYFSFKSAKVLRSS
jgi:hypothetical protein